MKLCVKLFLLCVFFNYFCSLGISRDVAQLGSVLAWGARGRRFKSCHPDIEYQTIINNNQPI